jgi:hypothetical protein
MKKPPYGIALILIIFLAGCNLPSEQAIPTSPEAAFTQAAETVAAELTRVSLLASPTPIVPTNTLIPTSTSTPVATNTLIATRTNTPIPCLMVGYTNATIDQTVPDNTKMAPGQVFTKKWRLINTGTCTWTSSYQLVFDRGDGMGVATGYSQSLTSGSISPGQSVDVSVNLTAPTTSGTYTGYWRFRDPNGTYFGIGGSSSWIVKIKVVSATTVTLVPVAAESGTIRSDAGPFPDYTIGESNADLNRTTEAFLSFDISDIPAGASISEVKINFKDYTITGDPFGSLGVLNGYLANYGTTLDQTDFVSGFPTGNIVDWGSTAPLNTLEVSSELKTAVQSKVGSSRLQLRLQFAGSNGDAVKDRITLNAPSLIVTYSIP